MPFTRAIVVGRYLPDDPIVAAFCAAGPTFGSDPIVAERASDIKQKLKRPGKYLALYCCLPPFGKQIQSGVSELITLGASVIVYLALPNQVVTPLAVQCLQGGALDVWLQGETTVEKAMKALRTLQREALFKPFNVGSPIPKNHPVVFVAASFDPTTFDDLKDAITHSLEARGFQVIFGDSAVTNGTIGEKVREQIMSCQILLADLTTAKTSASLHNPNVYYEIGFAEGRSLEVHFLHRGPYESGPIDVVGREVTSYDSALDLAKKLYAGFKDVVTTDL